MADFADEKDVANYEVLRAVVCYRLDGGALGWVGRQLKKLESRLDLDTSVSLDATMSSKESNTQKIIQGLGGEEMSAFTLEEFNKAVETHPNLKISASKHTREEYLPRVLDELEFTYHPNPTKDLFVLTDEIEIPDVRDPRSKPKAMLSEADKRLAVKVDALEKLASLSDSRERYQYEKGEAVGINGIAYNNAGKYMRQVADSPGFEFSEDNDVLRVDKRRVLDAEIENDDALEIIRQIASDALEDNDRESQDSRGEKNPSRNFTFPSGESSDDREEWIDQALEDFEDVDEIPEPALENVVRNKIARARYPDEIDETGTISDEAVERVTDEEIETVREELGLVQQSDELAGVDDQFEVLEAGRQAAATDGGSEE
ncbi:hypothetical protein [Natrialba aegyptia]|nr:hypothetical protein [Natrialba aegyptia]